MLYVARIANHSYACRAYNAFEVKPLLARVALDHAVRTWFAAEAVQLYSSRLPCFHGIHTKGGACGSGQPGFVADEATGALNSARTCSTAKETNLNKQRSKFDA